ncbi:MAG TPA: hypothetical protein VHS54_05610 [Jatrophihabitans sp.]|jgi:hypothetical protein|nr:hypothetical protein [Jatrophihabitans sp.]
MGPNARWIKSASAAAAAALAAVALSAGPARADKIPFSDPNATGTIGFCDRSGHEVTSGKIGAAPFAWTAVSSDPAPAGFAAPKGRASLFVYQPIRYVDPGDWSGKQLTAASKFTNTAHPMAQGTVLDPALVDFVSVFPPHWNGIVQLRMFFSAPDSAQHTGAYPAAVVQVKGDNWTLMSGGHPACGAGRSVSVETISLPKSAFTVKTPRATPGVTAPSGASASGSSKETSPAASTTSRADGAATVHPSNAAAATKSGGSSSSAGWWWLVAVVVVGAGGAVAWRVRRGSA